MEGDDQIWIKMKVEKPLDRMLPAERVLGPIASHVVWFLSIRCVFAVHSVCVNNLSVSSECAARVAVHSFTHQSWSCSQPVTSVCHVATLSNVSMQDFNSFFFFFFFSLTLYSTVNMFNNIRISNAFILILVNIHLWIINV